MQRVPDGEVLPGDLDVHAEIAAIIENPLYLLLDTTDGAGVRDLPVQILESEVLSSHFCPHSVLPSPFTLPHLGPSHWVCVGCALVERRLRGDGTRQRLDGK